MSVVGAVVLHLYRAELIMAKHTTMVLSSIRCWDRVPGRCKYRRWLLLYLFKNIRLTFEVSFDFMYVYTFEAST